jgi:hypothetical protein
MEKAEPRLAKLNTLILLCRTVLFADDLPIDKDEPQRTKLLRDSALPKETKSKTEIALPHLAKLLRDSEELK